MQFTCIFVPRTFCPSHRTIGVTYSDQTASPAGAERLFYQKGRSDRPRPVRSRPYADRQGRVRRLRHAHDHLEEDLPRRRRGLRRHPPGQDHDLPGARPAALQCPLPQLGSLEPSGLHRSERRGTRHDARLRQRQPSLGQPWPRPRTVRRRRHLEEPHRPPRDQHLHRMGSRQDRILRFTLAPSALRGLLLVGEPQAVNQAMK